MTLYYFSLLSSNQKKIERIKRDQIRKIRET